MKPLHSRRGLSRLAGTLLAGLAFLVARPDASAALPAGFSDTAVAGPSGGWNEAIGVKFESNGRMYVWERGGRVWFKDPADANFSLLLDISEEVMAFLDHGMIDFTLDPNFRVNGYLYVSYAVDRYYLFNYGTPGYDPATSISQAATIGRVTRYTARGSDGYRSVDYSSRRILIGETKSTGIPVFSDTHFGGALVFGTDGTLLVTTGDGASPYTADIGGAAPSGYAVQGLADGMIRPEEDVGAYRSQMLNSHSGKVLRIDPTTGDGVPSNPYYDATRPRSAQSRVFSLGLRNPFRATLWPGTGSHDAADANPGVLLIGDVGWNTWEELNVMTGPRQNFGWPLFEGNFYATLGSYTYNVPVLNRDVPNPLYPGTGPQYFNFYDLLKQDTTAAAGQPPFAYPSNPAVKIPASVPQFLQRRPVLDWNHDNEIARVPVYDSNGVAQAETLGAGSSVIGNSFKGNCSLGGIWYTGTSFPAMYQNTYFQGDWGTGIIKNIVFGANYRVTEVRDFLTGGGFVTSMAQHPADGSLYYVRFDYSASTVRRIAFTGNQPPVAVASADKLYGADPLTIQFTGSGSSDPNGDPLTYSWNFGDGTALSSQANPSHTFPSTGGTPTGYNVTLTVTDNSGASSQAVLRVASSDTPPAVAILSPVDGSSYDALAPMVVNLAATVQDAQSPDSNLTYAWYTILHHNEHTHASPPDASHTTTTVLSPTGPDDGVSIYFYEIRLVVTDPQGLATTRSVYLYPSYDGANTPPTISVIANQVTTTGTAVGPLAFTVGDAETVAGNLTVTGTSSNLPLVPAANIVFGGSGTNRTITVTPAAGQTGTATITVTVTDGSLAAVRSFTVTVNAPPPPAGLVAAYDFNEGTGTIVTDRSGNGNTGTNMGATWTTTGKYGGALNFDGTGKLVVINSSTSLALSGGMTLEAWVNPSVSQSGWRAIIQREVDAYFLHAGSNSALQPAGGGTFGSTVSFTSSGAAIPVGSWTHLALTYDGATLRLYANGVQVASKAQTGAIQSVTSPLRIGGNVPYAEYFLGQIDEVRIYNRALSATEIQGDMNTPVGGGNAAPTITSSLSATATVGVPFSYQITAANSPTSFGASGLPTGLSVNSASGIISGTPSIAGSSSVTISATNAAGTGSATLALTVNPTNPTNTPPTISALSAQTTTTGTAVGPLAFTVGDAETAAGSLVVSGGSSNLTLVPVANIVFGGSGASRTVTVTPAAGQTGTATITLTVSDGALSSSTTFALTVNAPTTGGLVAAYNFNEGAGTTVGDVSGNNNTGTITGATWTTAGKFGSALTFNGTSSVVLIGSSPSLNFTTAMTIEAWVYPTANQTGWRTIVQREVDAYLLHASSNAALAPAGGGTFNGTTSFTQAPTALPVNTWNHLALTYDGAMLRLYVNGVLASSKAQTGALQSVSSPLRIGSNTPYGEYFLGVIDEVRLYNRALSLTEIQTDMTTPVAIPSATPAISTVANQTTVGTAAVGPLGFTVSDPDTPLASLVVTATSSNQTLIPNANIVLGGSGGNRTVSLTAASGQVGTATLTLSVSDGFSTATSTFNVLVNPPAPVITSALTATGTAGVAFTYQITASNTPTSYGATGLPAGLTVNTTTGLVSGTPSTAATSNVSLSATNVTGTGTATLALTINPTNPSNTPPTITSLANQTTTAGVAVGPLAFTVGDVETAAGSLGVSGSSSNLTLVPTANIAFGGSGASRTVTVTPAVGQTGTATITVAVSDGSLTASTAFTLTVNPAPSGGLVAAYNFNEGTGTTVTDRSGNANTGTITGATWTTAGKFGSALTFTGSTNRVTVNSSASLSFTSAMTIEAWVYPTGNQSGWRTIVQKETDAYFLHAGSNQPLRPAGGGTFGASVIYANSSTAITVNTWTHLAVTYDQATIRLYVNGTQVASQARTGAIQTTTSPLRIGSNVPYGEYFQGRIDEVRVYNRALSAPEIQTDMNTPVGP